MKPKISYERSLLYKCMQWHCRGKGFIGMGDTPKDAYWTWRYFVSRRKAAPQAKPAPLQKGWPSDDLVQELAKASGFDFTPMPNLLYTVRGNHAQLVNFAIAMLAAAPQGSDK
jgi:hypothetical protein